jgi:hypothetical protein
MEGAFVKILWILDLSFIFAITHNLTALKLLKLTLLATYHRPFFLLK